MIFNGFQCFFNEFQLNSSLFNDSYKSQILISPSYGESGLVEWYNLAFEIDCYGQLATVDTGSYYFIAYNTTEQFVCDAIQVQHYGTPFVAFYLPVETEKLSFLSADNRFLQALDFPLSIALDKKLDKPISLNQ